MENDLSSWTKSQLQDHLREIGLKVSGNKAELIQRAEYAEVSQSEYSEMKVPQLKLLLKERKLAQTGRKAELINRLEANDTTNIAELPNEIFREVLHNLNDDDLAKTCRTDKRAANVCKDDLFWYERIKRKFNYDLIKYKEPDLSYRMMYKFLKFYRRLKIAYKLPHAVRVRFLPLVKYFIEVLGVKPHSLDIDSLVKPEELMVGSTEENDTTRLVKYLIETYGETHEGYNLNSFVFKAANAKNLELVKYLIEKGADIYHIDDDTGHTAFTIAAVNGALDVLKYMIIYKKPDDDNLEDAMQSAAASGELPVVKYLIEEHGFAATGLDTAMEFAIENGQYLIVKYLAENGADIDAGVRKAESRGEFRIVYYLESL